MGVTGRFGLKILHLKIDDILLKFTLFYDFQQQINNKTCKFPRFFKWNILNAKCPITFISYTTYGFSLTRIFPYTG